jgi:hypothetical protein
MITGRTRRAFSTATADSKSYPSPDQQQSVAESNIRLRDGSVDVSTSDAGSVCTTKVDATHAPATTLTTGHTLPAGASIASVQLDGSLRTD